MERLATTVEPGGSELLAFPRTGVTNAASEGTNRVIKTIAGDAYGFRNPEKRSVDPSVIMPGPASPAV
jgi:transposase